jgi:flagellin FlaB
MKYEKVGRISEILRKKDVGAMGIGAMIIFIAMVLVAGIAAAVLIQSANRLEIQAMETGEQTKKEVATGVHILDVEGHKNGTNGNIDYMTITIATRAGAGDVDLTQAFVEISDTIRKNVLKYDNTEFHYKSEVNGNIFQASFFNNLNGQDFGVLVMEDNDGSCTSTTPVINRGDKVMLLVNASLNCAMDRNIPERTDVWGMIQPEEGSAGVFYFTTPAAYTDAVFDLY